MQRNNLQIIKKVLKKAANVHKVVEGIIKNDKTPQKESKVLQYIVGDITIVIDYIAYSYNSPVYYSYSFVENGVRYDGKNKILFIKYYGRKFRVMWSDEKELEKFQNQDELKKFEEDHEYFENYLDQNFNFKTRGVIMEATPFGDKFLEEDNKEKRERDNRKSKSTKNNKRPYLITLHKRRFDKRRNNTRSF